MSQLLQTEDGDIDIGGNKFSLTSGSNEVRQRLKQNLQTFLGEFFLDTTIGVPYFQVVFDKSSPPGLVADVFKDAILKTAGVVELIRFNDLDLDSGTRVLTVDFDYRDEFSDGVLNFNEVV